MAATATKPKPKTKTTTPKTRKKTAAFKWIPLLLLFLLYTFCPSDTCSLDAPPVHALLVHAEPYIAPARPYVALARSHVAPRAAALRATYTAHVAPRLYWFFIDQYWNRIIKPIYFKGLHPHLEHHTRPYRIYYARFVAPALRRAAAHADATYARLAPHARRLVVTAYDSVRPHVLAAYSRVRPHARALFEHAKHHALVLAAKAGAARRQYVDPHVLRIWEKVGEPSSAEPRPEQDVESGPTTPTLGAATPEIATTPETATTPDAISLPSTQATSETATTPDAISLPSVHATPVPSAEHEAESAASVVAASLHADATLEPEVESTVAVTPEPEPARESEVESAVAAFLHAAATPEPEVESASLHAAAATPEPESESEVETTVTPTPQPSPASLPSPPSTPSPDPLSSFLSSIGLSPSPSPSSPSSPSLESTSPPTTPTPTQTPRHILTAQKRASITARHTKWQAELDALVRAQTHAARAALAASRGAAVARLARWGAGGGGGEQGQGEGEGHGEGHGGVVRIVEEEAGRLVRGLEAYAVGVEARMRAGAVDKEKEREREMWARVVEKVEERMAETVRDVHREVNEWFVGVREREVQAIDAIAEKVKSLAERAQADLGMDYAWLDDVTYYDWQKYHDLMRTSENFTSHAHKLQSQLEPRGTNALVDALNALEAEVGAVVDGFGVVVEGVRRRVGGVFVLAVRGEGEGFEGDQEGGGSEEVEILPVPAEKYEAGEVVMGRTREEVEARLEGVSVESVRKGREEL